VKQKSGMEVKGLKMNIEITKITFGYETVGRMKEEGKWPCSVCNNGYGNNLILYIVLLLLAAGGLVYR